MLSDIYYIIENDNTISIGVLNNSGKFIPLKKGFQLLQQAESWYKNRKAKKKKRNGIGR